LFAEIANHGKLWKAKADDRAPFKIEQSAVVLPFAVRLMKSGMVIASLLLASLYELVRGRKSETQHQLE
jgi:hypothetical protein